MSKKLAKIITICLLAVIIPVAIVSIALVLSSSIKYTVKLDKNGYESDLGSVVLKINGKVQDSLVVSRNSTVTLTVETQGYDFNGWYNGLAEDIDFVTVTPESTEKTISFKIKNDMNFTADVSIWNFNVSYDGGESTSVKYGEALKSDIVGKSDGTSSTGYSRFIGWTKAEDDKVYTTASFAKSEEVISLTSSYKAGYNKLTVKFQAVDLNNDPIEIAGSTVSTVLGQTVLSDLTNSFTDSLLTSIDVNVREVTVEGTDYVLNKIKLLDTEDNFLIDIGIDDSIETVIGKYNNSTLGQLLNNGTINIRLEYKEVVSE